VSHKVKFLSPVTIWAFLPSSGIISVAISVGSSRRVLPRPHTSRSTGTRSQMHMRATVKGSAWDKQLEMLQPLKVRNPKYTAFFLIGTQVGLTATAAQKARKGLK